MKKTVFIVGIMLIVALLVTGSVLAIRSGEPDNGAHPWVGFAVGPNSGGLSACSGSLISSRVFLTAAHCFDGNAPASSIFVTFEENGLAAFLSGNGVSGTFHPHPNWCVGCGPGLPGFDTNDVAVVVLDVDVAGPYATLPSVGLVDTLSMRTGITSVGYGERRFNPSDPSAAFERYKGRSELIASNHVISDEYIKLSANPAQGKGGTCFGDSGGPNFLGDSTTILAVNSFVTNGNCTGVTYSNRVDSANVLNFIAQFP